MKIIVPDHTIIDRETKEVVKSLMNSNGGMESWWHLPTDILKCHFIEENLVCNNKEEYLTHLVEQHHKEAFSTNNKYRLLINYPNFLNEFENKILPHFNITFSKKEIEKATDLLNFDSKTMKEIK